MADMSEALLDLADGVYDAQVPWKGMVRAFNEEAETALTAAAIPVNPPSDWFDDPKFRRLTPMTVDKTGRVHGHIAAWHTSHIGLAGGVKPPKSKSNYQFFRTGVVETDTGEMIDVGQITLAGGHAPIEASVARAVAHYDDTNSAVMDVATGEDKYGIWVAGALRPGVTDEQIRSIRASSVSGDWRPINGRLELVAVCAVNCPGFPIPRARVASGSPIALVAAGIEPLVEEVQRLQANDDMRLALEAFQERVSHLEETIVARGLDGGPDASELAEDLRRRVYQIEAAEPPADPTEDKEVVMASLRQRVYANDTVDVERLRARVHGV